MKLRFSSLGTSLSFKRAKTLQPNSSSTSGIPEQRSEIALGSSAPLLSCRTSFLFAYDIFPSCIMRAAPQRVCEEREMRVGDRVVQRVFPLPLGFGLCMEFAVRISAIINEPHSVGFVYETLEGHAEREVSEFYFEEREDGLFFVIHTRSEPGHWLSKLGDLIFTRPYQRWCTKQAHHRVQSLFHRATLSSPD